MENITYRLSDFEGPLDLLIKLIEKNKMDILNISISLICDQYLEFLDKAEDMDMEIATDFLKMASQLMLWKSISLLPREQEPEKPPRFDLTDILLRNIHMREAAPKMHPLFAYYNNRMVKDTDEISPDKTYVADQDVESLILAVRRINAYRETIEKAKTNFTPMISKPIIPVEGKINIIMQTLQAQGTASLRELLIDAPSLADMIASFMGVLELIKIRKILIEEMPDSEDGDSVHGEQTRFFINPEAPAEETPEGDAAPPADGAQ